MKASMPAALVKLHLPLPVIASLMPRRRFFSSKITLAPIRAAVIAAIIPDGPPPATHIEPLSVTSQAYLSLQLSHFFSAEMPV